jgi:tRNA threonylcarbamoyladenosine biosynthesis protein TsaB
MVPPRAPRKVSGAPGPGGGVLAVETATPTGSVAVVSDAGVLAELTVGLEFGHSDRLLGAIDRVLREASLDMKDLAGLAVSAGPGSFTGLRIGLATVKGITEAHPLPLAAVSTLEALAWNAPAGALPVCVGLDAKKGEIYGAIYRWRTSPPGWRPVAGEGAYTPGDLADRAARRRGEVILLGDGIAAYREAFSRRLGRRARFGEGPANQPRAAWVGWIGRGRIAAGEVEDPATLVPRYLRMSEAELARKRRSAPSGR